MRFNYWIGLLDETYLFLAVCCGLNLYYYWSWNSIGDSINSLIAIICSAAIFVFSIFAAVWYRIPKNF